MIVENLSGKRIISVSAGEQHSLALTEYGDLYCWGRNFEGQLGVGSRANSNVPLLVQSLRSERVVSIDCGSYHNICVTDSGKCYVWGKLHRFAEKGTIESQYFGGFNGGQEIDGRIQEMIDNSMKVYLAGNLNITDEQITNQFGNFISYMQTTPLLVEPLLQCKIEQVAAGYSFSIAITNNGEVYSWGYNEKGQCGVGHRFNIEFPKKIEYLNNVFIKQGSCGYEHTALVDNLGYVWTFGLGVFGALGHGDLHDQLIPKRIESLLNLNVKIVQVSCGSYYTTGRTEEGNVYSWGHGEYNQQGGTTNYLDWQSGVGGKERNLFHSNPRLLQGFQSDQKITQIACGHLHSVVILQNSQVYSFGWGTSGSLGHGDRRYQLVPKQVLAIRGDSISNVSCGWKHTLFVKSSDETTFAFDFKHLIDNKLYSDLTISVDGKFFVHCHSIFLFARSPLFAKYLLFQNRFCTGTIDKLIRINGIRYHTFMAFIRYLYTDHLRVASHLISELYHFAMKYEVFRLAHLCKQKQIKEEEIIVTPSTYKQELYNMVDNYLFSDISFLVEGTTRIRAHKCILTLRSEYFERLFEGNFKEKQQNTFIIDETISVPIFKDILNYLYTDNDQIITPDNCVELLHAADRFMINDLKLKIESYIQLNGMELENVAYLIEVSDRYGAQRLKRSCVDLISDNIDNWNFVKKTNSFNDLLRNNQTLIRELDYRLSNKGLTKPNEVLRLQSFVSVVY